MRALHLSFVGEGHKTSNKKLERLYLLRNKSNMSKADLILHGGNIITMDDTLPLAEAVGIKEGKIIFVGKKTEALKLAGPGTQIVELQGKETLLPGFIEPHQHAILMILNRCMYVNCGTNIYETWEEIKKLIETTVAATDPASGKWCIFLGWDPEMVPTLPKLDFDVLDSFSTEVPLVIIGQSGHVAWSNRKAFQVAEIPEDIENPDGGVFVRDANGKLTGQMLESPAMGMVIGLAPLPEGPQISKALDEQWDEYARCGFTTLTEIGYISTDADVLVQEKSTKPDCPIRLALYKTVYGPGQEQKSKTARACCGVPLPQSKKKGVQMFKENDKFWTAGIKVIADGSPHCGTAAVREPFLDTDLTKLLGFPSPPCYGMLNYDDDSLLETVKYWHEQGYQIASHTHGERAIEQVLKTYEQVLQSSKAPDRRHRLEHLGLCEEQHMVKAAELNLGLSFFVQHLYFYGKAYSESIFGPQRTNRWTPLSLATKHKLRWTIHQDHPTYPVPPQPLANMMTAVTRTRRGDTSVVYGKEYCVPIQEALKGYTINAAWQIHKEKELGSLTVGKKADLVILSENPLQVDPFKLLDIKVIETYLDGKCNNLR